MCHKIHQHSHNSNQFIVISITHLCRNKLFDRLPDVTKESSCDMCIYNCKVVSDFHMSHVIAVL